MRIYGSGIWTRGYACINTVLTAAGRLNSTSASPCRARERGRLLARPNTTTGYVAGRQWISKRLGHERGFCVTRTISPTRHCNIASSSARRNHSTSRSSSTDPAALGPSSSQQDSTSSSAPATALQPPLSSPFPASPSTKNPIDPTSTHHDLPTFLAHAERTGLSTSSTVYTGTVYEYLTLSTLRRYGFDLYRVGGRGDRGVDLVGFWRIPRRRKDEEGGAAGGEGEEDVLRVLVQCKRLVGKHSKLGPNLIRELDGAVRGARLGTLFESIAPRPVSPAASPSSAADSTSIGTGAPETDSSKPGSGLDPHLDMDATTALPAPSFSPSPPRAKFTQGNGPAVGVLVGTRPATKGVVESLRRSNRGLVWIMLEEEAVAVNGSRRSHGPPPPLLDPDSHEEASERKENNDGKHSGDASHDSDIDSDVDINIETDLDHQSPHSPAHSFSHSSPPTCPFPSPPIPLKGRIKQILWNQAARDLGLEGVDVIRRHTTTATTGPAGTAGTVGQVGPVEEIVLARGGTVILG